ncbi:preprotein translocase subunit SecG [Candidatus Schneideria nysicola]|uniref:preprotein translocase subunit SecG n=1 Tax=Candidatus Schneideria nysicola TaxID=1081631 RepID=UPI001CAA44BE|nr:preprotein translocase subunit SecG [Candidatus Schneideria nysicola]UAJ65366.1 preprotein translocase subunit SecG [Candidatus Schneideria nysicola]
MYSILLAIFILISVSLIICILLQSNENYNIGGDSRIGMTNNLLKSRSSSNIMTRITSILAILFFTLSLILGNINNKDNHIGSHSLNISTDTTSIN